MKFEKYPLPPDLKTLPAIQAEPWVKVGSYALEGAICDRDGNLYVCHRHFPWAEILCISPNGSIRSIYKDEDAAFVGLALHQDGRFYAADIDRGRILEISPDGKVLRDLLADLRCKKMMPDDVMFDRNGNLYFTDMSGNAQTPAGGIYCLSAESNYTSLRCVVDNLCGPNGLAFSPEEDLLWISETPLGRLDRIMLTPDKEMPDFFLRMLPCYQATGFEVVDSIKVDADGNVYLCIMFGGRVILFNNNGMPVANILLSDRSEGACMQSPNIALHPNKAEGYIVANGTAGAWIYRFPAPSPSTQLFPYQM